ncbi:MAG: hypothetical protein P8046_12225, partial [Anaerolineales bacterium]
MANAAVAELDAYLSRARFWFGDGLERQGTRPFGFWGPIRAKISPAKMEAINNENKRDILSTFFAVPW